MGREWSVFKLMERRKWLPFLMLGVGHVLRKSGTMNAILSTADVGIGTALAFSIGSNRPVPELHPKWKKFLGNDSCLSLNHNGIYPSDLLALASKCWRQQQSGILLQLLNLDLISFKINASLSKSKQQFIEAVQKVLKSYEIKENNYLVDMAQGSKP